MSEPSGSSFIASWSPSVVNVPSGYIHNAPLFFTFNQVCLVKESLKLVLDTGAKPVE
jgi:hypothetical protein